MPANSRVPSSAQEGIHRHLAALLERHRRASFRKPVADYNRAAFVASIGRWRRDAPDAPLILDAGCGTGESSLALAALFPGHYVIGVDRSEVRLRRRLAAQEASAAPPPGWPPNLAFARADLVDYWRLLRGEGVRLARHYLLYPNPWPKIGHLSRRWHGHPVFPALLSLGGVLECRSNWRIYVEEFCFAVSALTGREPRCESFVPASPLTPFERKYQASGHALYRAVLDWGGTGRQGSGVRGQGSGVRGQGSGVRGQESGIRNQRSDQLPAASPPHELLIPDL
jgi:tRNA (guanine-N7-)-methyltransferase